MILFILILKFYPSPSFEFDQLFKTLLVCGVLSGNCRTYFASDGYNHAGIL